MKEATGSWLARDQQQEQSLRMTAHEIKPILQVTHYS
jgi:hypothetical protein